MSLLHRLWREWMVPQPPASAPLCRVSAGMSGVTAGAPSRGLPDCKREAEGSSLGAAAPEALLFPAGLYVGSRSKCSHISRLSWWKGGTQ